jgi:hypothetical protein
MCFECFQNRSSAQFGLASLLTSHRQRYENSCAWCVYYYKALCSPFAAGASVFVHLLFSQCCIMHGPDYVFITLSIFFFLHKNIVQSFKMKKRSIKGKTERERDEAHVQCCSRLLAGPNEFGLASSSRERNAAVRRRTSQKRERRRLWSMGLQWRQTNWEADQSASGKRRKRERDENQLPYTPRPPKAPAPLLHLLLLLPPSLIFFFFFLLSHIYNMY